MSGKQFLYVIGCDPGFTGALAFLASDGSLLSVVDMPIIESDGKHKLTFDSDGMPTEKTTVIREYDRLQIKNIMQGWVECTTNSQSIKFIGEKMWSRPDQGSVSTSKLMWGAGLIEGIAIGLGVPTALVAPQTWKTKMGVTADKRTSLAKATQTFPEMAQCFRLVKHNGRAEAALIARWEWLKSRIQ